jgi:hypothetical protein
MNISKATGYHHGRRLQRMTQDSSIRNTSMTEVGMGLAALFGLALPIIFVVMIFGLG